MEGLYALALGYLLGSVPFGLILTNLFGEGNLRSIGSGNIGATNVLRTGNKGLAAATLLLDGAKGFLAVWLAMRWFAVPATLAVAGLGAPLAGLGAVLGHCFPVWLKFKGGKGVATTLGVTLALSWPIGLTYAAVWLAVVAVTRISSAAGLSAVAATGVAAILLGRIDLLPVLAFISALVFWLHRENIARIRAGTEPKVGQKS
ncbi:MAG: glycerol-3-phosphate 1-O-acyltransferase PlsY [Sphingomonadales bacterium]|nr:glycerol-3-phosphate 1-O-acyltransferase PlsY [Sphingomonadaceae bacterium]MBS3931159.1 glycerol-3-phosphate 1-O-acyltransferase PlsY [Sphingomonadales bacterium]